MYKRGRRFTVLILLVIAVSIAIIQGDGIILEDHESEDFIDLDTDIFEFEEEPEIPPEPLPEWVMPARWYRSNSAGMMLEESVSRLAAMRNEYALVTDFVNKQEVPEILLPYSADYFTEIRVLYKNAEEYRRQWIFRDINGLYRVVAVFTEDVPEPTEENRPENEDPADPLAEDQQDVLAEEAQTDTEEPDNSTAFDMLTASEPEIEEQAPELVADEYRLMAYQNYSGFIEIYGDDFLLEREIIFSGEYDVRETQYFYNKGTLIRVMTTQNNITDENGDAKKLYTDTYRYNRSGSLRSIERIFHERLDDNKTRLAFANRVLDAAANSMFTSDQLFLSPEFFVDTSVEPDQKMVFTTDDRFRILTQSLFDSEGELIWIITNTWSGEHISSALRVEGDDLRLNEYEYNSDGDIIAERFFHNKVLQRQVFYDGNTETEELFMNGIIALRAIWVDGRKISEQRIRPGEVDQ